jgi:ABC-type transport system involved in multi-copper enzyme maturation permease subunit
MSSYVAANLIYQAFLCLCQSGITLAVLRVSKMTFPVSSYVTGSAIADMFITVFLISYSADVISLFISSVVKSTTTAMTLMPFLLIFQLIFSGGFFSLSARLMKISDFTVSKWGLTALCAQGDYNDLPMVAMWNALFGMQDYELSEETKNTIINAVAEEYNIPDEARKIFADQIPDNAKPIKPIVYKIQGYDKDGNIITDENGNNIGVDRRRDFELECGKNNRKEQYVSTTENITDCWGNMIVFIVIFAAFATISLEFIDRDKR